MTKVAVICDGRTMGIIRPAIFLLSALLLAACGSVTPATVSAPTAILLPASQKPARSPTPLYATPTSLPTATRTYTPLPPTATADENAQPSSPSSERLGDIYNFFPVEIYGLNIVKTASGTVASAGTAEERVLIDSTIGMAMFDLFWQEGELDFTLIRPDGSIIDPEVAEADRMIEFSSDTVYKFYRVDAPQDGEWTLHIKGISTPPEGEKYAISVSSDDAMIFYGTTDKPEYSLGSPIKLTVGLEDSFLDVGPTWSFGAKMQVVAQDSAGHVTSFDLLDDGRHFDGEADDGIYANIFTNTSVAGSYNFFLNISGLNRRHEMPFTREFTLSTTVTEAPETYIFMDGFDSSYLSAWSSSQTDGGDLSVDELLIFGSRFGMQSLVDDGTPIYVQDDSPEKEPQYYAGFVFDPNSVVMSDGSSHAIFSTGQASGPAPVKIALGWVNGAYVLQAGVYDEESGYKVSPLVSINENVHSIEIYWQAASEVGASDGQFSFWVDSVEYANLTNINNATQRVEYVRLGAVSGVDSSTSGSIHFDDFVSRHQRPEILLGESDLFVYSQSQVMAGGEVKMLDDFLD